MPRRFLYLVFLTAVLALLPRNLLASDDWPKPSAEELSMTSEPKAPGAPAIILYREEITDNANHQFTQYLRIKILTDAGLTWATVELPSANFQKLEARTVQPDGTVVPFTGKPYKKLISKGKGWNVYRNVITLPAVQVGSIVEFRVRFEDSSGGADWILQAPLFIKKEAFGLYPAPGWYISYLAVIPSGVKPVQAKNVAIGESKPSNRESYSLLLTDVPAFEREEHQPPDEWASWHVNLYYHSVAARSKDEYWRDADGGWSENVDKFLKPNATIQAAAAQLVAPGDTDRQKAEKIYREVMKFDNLTYTHARTARENKALNYGKLVTLADNWKQRRGGDDYLAFLYISLARAAGLHAYAMLVADRRRHIFTDEIWNFNDQLDDVIAIVTLDGKDVFLDPGALYCPFGQLAWFHATSSGVRQDVGGTTLIARTPYSDDAVNRRIRTADVKLTDDGNVTGTVRFEFYGQQAMEIKQSTAETDNPEVEKDFEDSLRDLMPVDAKIKLEKITGLQDLDAPVAADFTIDAPLATRSGKHLLLPTAFFRHFDETFTASVRTQPVLLPFAYRETDIVNIELPPGITAEALPKDMTLPLKQFAVFQARTAQSANTLKFTRTLAVGTILYQTSQYPELHDFFGAVRSANTEQAILKVEKQVATN